MPLGPDPSYGTQSKFYVKQQPAGTTLNGNTVATEAVEDVGSLVSQYGLQSLNGQILPAQILFTIAKGSANVCVVTAQVADNGGQAIAGFPFDLDVILSDNANGVGITATAPSSSASVTTGTVLNTYTANKAFYAQTDATGKVVLTITDTGKTGYYVMVQAGCQPLPSVSRQLTSADYG